LASAPPAAFAELSQGGAIGADNETPSVNFDGRPPTREALQTRSLIAGIDRGVQILNSEIALEKRLSELVALK
jgi:hypothetical protein